MAIIEREIGGTREIERKITKTSFVNRRIISDAALANYEELR